ncbi:unnamed protein product, partial [Nesidiocoris tenuis]
MLEKPFVWREPRSEQRTIKEITLRRRVPARRRLGEMQEQRRSRELRWRFVKFPK